MREVIVDKIPACDICKDKPAVYDCSTQFGPAAYLCEDDFQKVGKEPAVRLKLRDKTLTKSEKPLRVKISLEQAEEAAFDGAFSIECPNCGHTTLAEPDAKWTLCEGCESKIQLINPFF